MVVADRHLVGWRGSALLCLGLWRGLHAARPQSLQFRDVVFGARTERQQLVVDAFRHAWQGYKAFCWGKDELRPVTQKCSEHFGGLGIQIVDALDSLLLMGLKAEYREAREWVLHNFTAELSVRVNVFEVTIRILGGLLSAYFLTGDAALLERARDLGLRLLPAWREGPMPHELVNLATGSAGLQDLSLGSTLSEVGSLQLEFKALSAAIGDPRFRWRAEHVTDFLGSLLLEAGGLLPIMFMPNMPMRWTNSRVTLGARGDSFYEYLLKQWLQTNRTEPRFLEGYQAFVRAVRLALAGRSNPSNLSFVREGPSLEALQLASRLDGNETWQPLEEIDAEVVGPLAFMVKVPGAAGPDLAQRGLNLGALANSLGLEAQGLNLGALASSLGLEEEEATTTCQGEADGGGCSTADGGDGGGEAAQWGDELEEASASRLHRLMQALFGHVPERQKLVYVVVPAMRSEEVCTTAELLLTRRWDKLHKRIGLGVPPGLTATQGELLRESVAQTAGAQLVAQCEKRGRFKMDHLACFLPGVLALGVMTGAAVDAEAELDLAAGLAEACAHMWLAPQLGLAPEIVSWNVVPGRPDMEVISDAAHSCLRPETVESLWYLHLATGDSKYQEWGWTIFEAIERHTRMPDGGYSGIEDVTEAEPRPRDLMETYVLSETFKYLFLLFADTQPFDVTQIILNTEAHLLPVLDPTRVGKSKRGFRSRS